MMVSTQARIAGGLLGAIAGETVGLPIEDTSRDLLTRSPVMDMEGWGTHMQIPGTWGTSSSLILATMHSLMRAKKVMAGDIMKRHISWLQGANYTPHGTVLDTSSLTYKAIKRFSEGIPLKDSPEEEIDDNGSLLRILPVALWLSESAPKVVVENALVVGALTHAHSRSLMSCTLFGLLVQGLILAEKSEPKKRFEDAFEFACDILAGYMPEEENVRFRRILDGEIVHAVRSGIQSSNSAVDTMEAAIWAVSQTPDFKSAVLWAVNLGGGTPQVAGVTGALAGLLYGWEGIPSRWYTQLARPEMLCKAIPQFARMVEVER